MTGSDPKHLLQITDVHLRAPTAGTLLGVDTWHSVSAVLEQALALHPHHAGLCHLYVHLSEMSAHPELALQACEPLRAGYPHAGHLIHMPTQ